MSNKKFRVWDSKLLEEIARLSLQLKHKIEEIAVQNKATPEELPDSLLPTERLYMLVLAYTAAYDRLVEYDLLHSGNPKQTKNTH